MPLDIHSKGSPTSQIWVLSEEPYPQDKDKRFLFSGSYGYVFDKMMRDAGLYDYYVTCRRPDLDDRNSFRVIEDEINHFKPPIIICLEEAGKHLCQELRKKPMKQKGVINESDSEIEKYAGSLLQSDLISYPHFILPTFSPDTICRDWSLRDIVVSLDLGKIKDELDYYQQNGKLQDLPIRDLKYDIKDYEELVTYLERFNKAPILSNDIENIYTNKKSAYWPHPGEIVTVGLADSVDFGISFNLFGYDKSESRDLFRRLDNLFRTVPQLGQNFFTHDLSRYEALGFEIDKFKIQDTLIRQHVLFPELPKSLQFMTRQYTRQPYYKDEGKQWNMKDMKKLKRYNCLDVCVTMEVYLAQDREFNERPHLR